MTNAADELAACKGIVGNLLASYEPKKEPTLSDSVIEPPKSPVRSLISNYEKKISTPTTMRPGSAGIKSPSKLPTSPFGVKKGYDNDLCKTLAPPSLRAPSPPQQANELTPVARVKENVDDDETMSNMEANKSTENSETIQEKSESHSVAEDSYSYVTYDDMTEVTASTNQDPTAVFHKDGDGASYEEEIIFASDDESTPSVGSIILNTIAMIWTSDDEREQPVEEEEVSSFATEKQPQLEASDDPEKQSLEEVVKSQNQLDKSQIDPTTVDSATSESSGSEHADVVENDDKIKKHSDADTAQHATSRKFFILILFALVLIITSLILVLFYHQNSANIAVGPSGSPMNDPLICGNPALLQADYRGTISVTRNGKTCQRWDHQHPHEHEVTAEEYPDAGLEENYCRNPDGKYSAVTDEYGL